VTRTKVSQHAVPPAWLAAPDLRGQTSAICQPFLIDLILVEGSPKQDPHHGKSVHTSAPSAVIGNPFHFHSFAAHICYGYWISKDVTTFCPSCSS
jgi:hypothetical protein